MRMKHAFRRLLCLLLSAAALLSLAACTSPLEEKLWEILTPTLVQGDLDALYLGEFNENYLDLTGASEEDCQSAYEQNLSLSADIFARCFGITNLTDDLRSEVEDLYREIYARAHYSVVGAVQIDETHYTVTVNVEPMDFFTPVLDGFDDAMAGFRARWIDYVDVSRLNGLIEKVFGWYDNYEFHAISHAINDFCVIDLSSFYFDIIKDRLYCDGADSLSRRSAQTALFLILDTMTKMFAPILAFTCDEIWLAMPHRASDDGRNVLLNEMSKPYTAYALSEDEMTKWARIAAVRNVVNGALEQARADKTIGKSLEAEVDLVVPHEDVFLAEMDPAALADTLLVSQVRVAEGDELSVEVRPANGCKCGRCWKVLPTVGSDAAHADLCPRCAAVMAKLPELA